MHARFRTPTNAPQQHRHAAQRGVTMMSLLVWSIVVAFGALLALKVFPSVNEYLTIRRAVEKIMQSPPDSVPAIRQAFDRQKTIEYAITSIDGNDLDIDMTSGHPVVRFAYDKEIDLFGPVYLLIKYRGGAE